jgi:hypothetical protein
MPSIPRVPAALILLAWSASPWPGAPAAWADEARVDDLRLEWSPLLGEDTRASGRDEHDIPALGVSDHSTLDLDLAIYSHQRVAVGFFRSLDALEADRGSFLLGLVAAYDRIETVVGSVGASEILDGFAGFVWGMTPAWHVEQGFLVGAGRSRWRLLSRGSHFDSTDSSQSSTGFVYEYGVRLGTTYTWRQVVAALDLRYLVTETKQEFSDSYSHNGIDETETWRPDIRYGGVGVTFGLGYRF